MHSMTAGAGGPNDTDRAVPERHDPTQPSQANEHDAAPAPGNASPRADGETGSNAVATRQSRGPAADGSDADSTDASDADAASGALAPVDPGAVNENDIANWLVENPDFFDRYGAVLLGVKLADSTGGRAISLHERQLAVLRDNERALERRLSDLVRAGQENDAIADRLARFTRDLLLVRRAADMPARIEATLADSFKVPLVVVRIWDVVPAHASEFFVVQPDARLRERIDDMTRPYCGLHTEMAPVDWFDTSAGDARSVALIPLRRGADPSAFGLIMLGSPDPDRFQTHMGTAFLERIAEVASAALSRLRPDGTPTTTES